MGPAQDGGPAHADQSLEFGGGWRASAPVPAPRLASPQPILSSGCALSKGDRQDLAHITPPGSQGLAGSIFAVLSPAHSGAFTWHPRLSECHLPFLDQASVSCTERDLLGGRGQRCSGSDPGRWSASQAGTYPPWGSYKDQVRSLPRGGLMSCRAVCTSAGCRFL